MGETTGELNEGVGEHKSSDQIRDDIRQTQRKMSDTVDSIHYRLSPSHMMEEAKDTLRDAPRRAGEGLMNRIKDNPIPAAIAGLGLWMLFRSDKSSDSEKIDKGSGRMGGRYYPQGGFQNDRGGRDFAPYGYNEGFDSEEPGRMAQMTDTAKDKVASVKEKASDLAENISDKAHDLSDKAHDLGDRAQQMGAETWDRAEQFGHRVSYQTRTASHQLWDTLHENPLIFGAAGAVIGAILGASLPETQRENRLMGDASDSVKETARDYAKEGVEKVKHVASAATDAATEEMHKEFDDPQPQTGAGSKKDVQSSSPSGG